jgi:hypothetical protein
MAFLTGLKERLLELLEPAKDPRLARQGEFDSHHRLIAQVRRAHAGLSAARTRLEAHLSSVRRSQISQDSSRPHDPFQEQLSGLVNESVADLEAELILLDREQEELTHLEERLVAEEQVMKARQQAVEAQEIATEARSRVHEQLGAAIVDLARFGVVMNRVEEMARQVDVKVATASQVAELATIAAGREDRGKTTATRYAVAASQARANETRRLLAVGFRSVIDLETEFRHLRALFESPDSTELLTGGHAQVLVGEAYRQGLSVLAEALSLIETLPSETSSTSSNVAPAVTDQTDQAAISGTTDTSGLIAQAEELLGQAQRCVMALNQTRRELTSARVEGSRRNAERATQRLQEAIDQAKAIQAELQRLEP